MEVTSNSEQFQETEGTVGGDAHVMLENSVRIYYQSPLPELNGPTSRAYHAELTDNPGTKVFALVCQPGLPPRLDTLELIRTRKLEQMLKVFEWGVIPWPPVEQSVMVVIYELPLGGRVIDHMTAVGKRMHEPEIINLVIEPMILLLEELEVRGTVLRNIRADNLYYLDAERTMVRLGDCVTTPPGYDQPLIYETIERGPASRAGRGRGSRADDFYALGVTIMVLALGLNAYEEMKSGNPLLRKFENGSFVALVGSSRVSIRLVEPLKGLLMDSAEHRWTLEELTMWKDGRRMTPKQNRPHRRSNRSLTFCNHDYFDAPSLAYAMCKEPQEAIRIIREGQLETWLRRGLEYEELAVEVGRVAAAGTGFGADRQVGDEILLSQVVCVLNPVAPINYKTLSFMPDSLGAMLAYEYANSDGAKLLIEAIQKNVPTHWFSLQKEFSGEYRPESAKFAQIRGYLQSTEPGYGIERALYELNPGLHCLSPLVASAHVLEVDHLLPTLEAVANQTESSVKPVDRHIAAFVDVRSQDRLDNMLKNYGSRDPKTRTMGMLGLLAIIQWRHHKSEQFMALASWVGGLLGPVLDGFHNRTIRRQLEREVPRLVRTGSLPELYQLLDNKEVAANDQQGFEAAKKEFAATEVEIERLAKQGPDSPENAYTGEQSAAIISMVSAITITILYLIVSI